MIRKGYSTKQDGNMYLATDGWEASNLENRRRYFAHEGIHAKNIVAAQLVHGTRVAVITSLSAEFLLGTDALVSAESDIVLTLTGADCFPVFFEDSAHGVIGLAHGGWRGIVGGVLEATLETLRDQGGLISDTRVTLGPGICERHFGIQTDILERFSLFQTRVHEDRSGIRVDLRGMMRDILLSQGVAQERLIDMHECTYCLPEKYFSFRRDRPRALETQVAYIVQ